MKKPPKDGRCEGAYGTPNCKDLPATIWSHGGGTWFFCKKCDSFLGETTRSAFTVLYLDFFYIRPQLWNIYDGT